MCRDHAEAPGGHDDGEPEGGVVEGVAIPIQVFTLVALGVHLFDNLGLEDLARTASKLGRWEFLFTASPTRCRTAPGRR